MNLWNKHLSANLSGIEKKQFLAQRAIVKQLYLKGSLSAAELCKQLLLSTPTATLYINKLMELGYVEERGFGDSEGGRKPMQYGLKPNSFYVLAVDIGRRTVRISLFSSQLKCVHKWEEKSFDLMSGRKQLVVLEQYIKCFLQELTIDMNLLIGIGVVMPGLVDSSQGRSYTYLCEETDNLAGELSARLGKTVYLENDAKARAFAEFRHGAAQDSKNAMVVYVGNGLGLGMILDGKLHAGKSGFAGEFSHIPIENNERFCQCGKVGCLETIASGMALVRMAEEAIAKGRQTTLISTWKKNGFLLPEQVVVAAQEGDCLSVSLLHEVGANLGKGIAYLVQILNPDKVVLVGRVARGGDLLVNAVKQALYSHCLPKLREDVRVEMSKLDSEAGLLGAATMMIEAVL